MLNFRRIILPANQPFTPESEALIVTALTENINGPGSSEALASEFVNAFVNYVAAATELGLSAQDGTDIAMAKYGPSLDQPEYANIRTYVEARLAGL